VPELPEVETIRRQLVQPLQGRTVQAAATFGTPKFASAPDATGATITSVGRRGKYLLLGLDDDRELVLHLGMTGVIELAPHAADRHRQVVPGDRSDGWMRAWWHLDDGTVLELHDPRRFGRIAVVPSGDHRTLPTLATLGPEPLGPDFTPTHLHDALGRSGRRVKTQLLGQRAVAGVGNINADEALWRAGIDPGTRHVGRRRAAALHGAIVDVLGEAIDHGGTRIRDCRTVEGDTCTHQHHLACYGQAGLPCVRCGTPLRHRVLDGRGTTSCPRCQKR
jgi:formamidopyrimidine-DNA glycosylase